MYEVNIPKIPTSQNPANNIAKAQQLTKLQDV